MPAIGEPGTGLTTADADVMLFAGGCIQTRLPLQIRHHLSIFLRKLMHQYQHPDVEQQGRKIDLIRIRTVFGIHAQHQFACQLGTAEGTKPICIEFEAGTIAGIEGPAQGDAQGQCLHHLQTQHPNDRLGDTSDRTGLGEIGGIGQTDDPRGECRVLFYDPGQIIDLQIIIRQHAEQLGDCGLHIKLILHRIYAPSQRQMK